MVLARPIVLIPHLFRLASAFIFRKDYSLHLVRHLDPTAIGLQPPLGGTLGLKRRFFWDMSSRLGRQSLQDEGSTN